MSTMLKVKPVFKVKSISPGEKNSPEKFQYEKKKGRKEF